MYIPPPLAHALWYCLVADTETDRQLAFTGPLVKAQVAPESNDLYIPPPLTHAVWYCPVDETETALQVVDGA